MFSIDNIKNLFSEQEPEALFLEIMLSIENNEQNKFVKLLKKLKKIAPKHIDTFDQNDNSLLKKCIDCNNLEFVKILISNKVNTDLLDLNQQSPIFQAVIQNKLTIFKLLLETNFNVNQTDFLGNTLLHYAIANMNLTIVNLLLEKNIYQDIKNKSNDLAIHEFLKIDNSVNISNFILKSNLNYNLLDQNRNSLLHLAAINKNNQKIKELLSLDKIKINAINFLDQTALDIALKNNVPESVVLSFLNKSDLDLLYKDKRYNTILHMLIELYEESTCLLFMKKLKNKNFNNINDRKETEFSLAAKRGYLKVIQDMINYSTIVFEQNNNGNQNALVYLLEKEKFETASMLIDKGANLFYTLTPNRYIIDYFTEKSKSNAVKFIINKQDINGIPNENFNALFTAVSNNDLELVKIIIHTMDSKNLYNCSLPLIHMAITNHNIAIAEILIQKGANLLNTDDFGNTPLFHAIKNEKQHIVDFIINRMLNVDQICEDGLTAFEISIINNKPGFFLSLLDKTNIKRINSEGVSPLHLAIKQKIPEFVQQLLIAGALERDKKYQGYDNRLTNLLQNCFYYAAGYSNTEILEILIDYGADPNEYSSHEEEPPINNAIRHNNYENVKFLLSLNVKLLSFSFVNGESALHIAVRSSSFEICELILQHHTNINLKSKTRGLTPLEISILEGRDEIAILLLNNKATVNQDFLNTKDIKFFIEKGLYETLDYLLQNNFKISEMNDEGIPGIIFSLSDINNKHNWFNLLNKYNVNILEKDLNGLNILDYIDNDVLLQNIKSPIYNDSEKKSIKEKIKTILDKGE